VIAAYPFRFNQLPPGGPASWGAYGDYFGGILNPIVAFAALVALLYGLSIQRKELQAAREQLKESAIAQTGLVAATSKSHHFVYASSLVPLLEASRHEITAIMESKISLTVRYAGHKQM